MRELILSILLSIGVPCLAQRQLAEAYLTGTATETGDTVAMTALCPEGVSTGCFESYQRLQAGTYWLGGVTCDGCAVRLGSDGEGRLTEDGAAFTVDHSYVARLRLDSAAGVLEVTPVELYLKGNVAAAGTTLPYIGAGVFGGTVTLTDAEGALFADKQLYFAFNDDASLTVARRGGTRRTVALAAEGYPTEAIHINGGTYTITLDMTNHTCDIVSPIDEYKISAFGSSVCNGQGAEDNHGYAYLYDALLATRYATGASAYPFTISGISIGGNNTHDLLRRYDDLLHDGSKYVLLGVSLGNEGIHGAADQQAVFDQFRDNMLSLLRRLQSDGKTAVVMNNYGRSDFTAADYDYVQRINLLIHTWAVPSVNVLGAIDDGAGHWAAGYEADTAHPTAAGHSQIMSAIPASLFDALEQGKALPLRDTTQATTLRHGATLQLTGETPIHPFTVTIRFRGDAAGDIITTRGAQAQAVVRVSEGGYIQYVSSTGATLTAPTPIAGDSTAWHYLTLTNYYAQRRTLLYLDTICLGEVCEALAPATITIGDATRALTREYSELFFWRAALTAREVCATVNGALLKGSLDIYSPLPAVSEGATIVNRAQSLNAAIIVAGTLAGE